MEIPSRKRALSVATWAVVISSTLVQLLSGQTAEALATIVRAFT